MHEIIFSFFIKLSNKINLRPAWIEHFSPSFLSQKQFLYMYSRWFRIFQTSRYQGIVKATVSGVVEDLKFKISEGSDQNWSCPDSAQLAVSV